MSQVFVIAELSANHLNNFDIAIEAVHAIADSGADAIKVQTFTADSICLDLDNKYFGPLQGGLWDGIRPYELFTQAAMPWDWQPKLKRVAEERGLEFFSSPFDVAAVDFLEDMGVRRYKIASFEITDIPLIEYVAKKQKPIIISSGVATQRDLSLAVATCKAVGNDAITLLKCTSEYPASTKDANLRCIPDMQKRHGLPVGVSDHTLGSLVPIIAVSLGAVVVEKHFTLDRKMGGADSAFSMEPAEFRAMVEAVRETESALGKVSYEVSDKDKLRRRSLFASEDIEEGGIFTMANIRSVRPGHGMHPKRLAEILGAKASVSVRKGTPLTSKLIMKK